MAAEHAANDSELAADSAKKATEESFESAIAGAVFESEHVKNNPTADREDNAEPPEE